MLTLYLSRQTRHVPIVSDPDRVAYRAFGLEQTGWLTFFRPKVLAGYLAKIALGHRLKTPYEGEDVLQLGGDFLLNRHGEIVYAYRSAEPTDRPTLEALFGALGSAVSARTMPPERPPDSPRVDTPPTVN